MTLANKITSIRLIITLLVAYPLLVQGITEFNKIPIVLSLILCVLLDVLDGYVARSRNESTQLGSYYDHFVDILGFFLILVYLSINGLMEFWYCGLVLLNVYYGIFMGSVGDGDFYQSIWDKFKDVFVALPAHLLFVSSLLDLEGAKQMLFIYIVGGVVFPVFYLVFIFDKHNPLPLKSLIVLPLVYLPFVLKPREVLGLEYYNKVYYTVAIGIMVVSMIAMFLEHRDRVDGNGGG